MAVNHIKLRKPLPDKKLKRVDLKALAGISGDALAKSGKDKYASERGADGIRRARNCNIGVFTDVIHEEKQFIAGSKIKRIEVRYDGYKKRTGTRGTSPRDMEYSQRLARQR